MRIWKCIWKNYKIRAVETHIKLNEFNCHLQHHSRLGTCRHVFISVGVYFNWVVRICCRYTIICTLEVDVTFYFWISVSSIFIALLIANFSRLLDVLRAPKVVDPTRWASFFFIFLFFSTSWISDSSVKQTCVYAFV